ncbi:MAG: OprO/OprP family phosphate-selective porin [Muribaculaceae bacterium]|nr:OprO/OprP family phosphate-selective porin [Muribaculaceae bacterium]
MPEIKHLASAALLAISLFPASQAARAAEEAEKVDLVPKIHGVIRTRYEGEWGGDDGWRQRFQVRNARVSLEGQVLRQLSYFIRVDACDRGTMKFLDAYGQWSLPASFRIRAGQFRVPFGVDVFRGPGTYIFANRSFVGKNLANVREVGVQGGYYGRPGLPLTVEAGVFNSKPMADHEVWQKGMDFAAKATWKPGGFTVSASYLTMKPYGVRMNLVDGTFGWNRGRWVAEAEYQHKHYERVALGDTDAWSVFASYALPLRKTVFDNLSFHGRFDSMTANSTGKPGEAGGLTYSEPSRRRITAGTMLEYLRAPLRVAVRVNYEKYFYDSGVEAPAGADDKIVAELVIKF